MMYLYQSFIFLLGHLHFFSHFSFMFMENLFKKTPYNIVALKISTETIKMLDFCHFPFFGSDFVLITTSQWYLSKEQGFPHQFKNSILFLELECF